MKKKVLSLFSSRVLLLVMAFVGAVSSAWADGVTVSMTSFVDISGYVDGDENISYEAGKGTASTPPAVNNGEIRVYQNGGTFTVTSNNNTKINSITLGSSMATTVTYSIDGGNTSGNQTISANGTISLSDLDCSSVLFTCTGTSKTARLYVNSLSVTYSSSGGNTPTLAESDFALTGDTDLSFDLYDNDDAQVINFTTSSTGAVTVADNAYVSAVVGNGTITVTPLKKTNGEVEITVNQAKDDDYKAGSATFTVTITDSTPVGDEEIIDFTAQSYTNQEVIDSYVGNGCTVTFDKGTNSNNAPKYFTTGTAIRAYGGNTITVTSTCNKNIGGIIITFGSGDGSNAITANVGDYDAGTWTGDAESVTFTIGGTSGNRRITGIEVTYADASDTRIATTTTIDATGITNTNIFDGTDAGQLVATVSEQNGNAIQGAAVTWSSSNDAVATIETDGTVTLGAEGEVTFTATYAGDDSNYKGSTATYTLTVTNEDPNKPGASADNPYTVAQAIDAIDNSGDVTDVFVAGIVSQVDNYSSSKYITYWISADGTTESQQFEVYHGLNINGANFSSKDDIQVGDVVVVKGNITLYNSSVYEFSANNQLVSLTRPAQPADPELAFETTSYEVEINGDFDAPELTNPHNLTVTYSSSDESLASVDENDGTVDIYSTAGSVTITASFAGDETYKAGSASYTINIIDPATAPTYVALVAQYDGKYYAINETSGATWGATAVDAVNGKVINAKKDALSWDIVSYGNGAGLKNKATNNYIAYKSSGTELTASNTIVQWNIDRENNTWTNQNGKTSGTVRTLIYNGEGFKNYAVSNVNGSGYSGYTTAYTFSDGHVREVTAGAYGTICLPFAVAAGDFAGVKFYQIVSKKMSGETLKYVNLEEVTSLAAGAAYIYQADEEATKLIAAYSGEEVTAVSEAALSGTGLTGTFEKAYIPQGKYMMKNGNIYLVDQANYIYCGANKAYIDLTDVPEEISANIKGIRLYNGDIETGISAINAESLNGSVYNLAGQRVKATKAGIYVAGGKKVVVK